MHHLKVDIVDPDTNTILKSNVNMTTDGKLSVCEMNDILFAQGGNVFRVVEVVERDPFLPWKLF